MADVYDTDKCTCTPETAGPGCPVDHEPRTVLRVVADGPGAVPSAWDLLGIGRPADPMAYVRALLAESRAAVNDGRDLIERGVTLRGEAFDALPVGVFLRFDSEHVDFMVARHTDGWFGPGGKRQDDVWVREQWDRSNWRIVGENDLG